MKSFLIMAMTLSLTSSAFAQQNEFNQLPIAQQASYVSHAKAELAALEVQLKDAKLKRVAAVAVGITSATVSVLGAFMAVTSISTYKSVSGGLKATFLVIGVGAAATSAGTGYGAYKSFKWFQAKNTEIDGLLREIEKARVAVEAADRAYQVILN